MSSHLYRLGRAAYRRRVLVVLAWLLVLVTGIVLMNTLSKGTNDTVRIPGSSSQNALDTLNHVFPQVSGTSAKIVVAMPEGSSVSAQPVKDAVGAAVDEIDALDQVSTVASPFSSLVDGAVSDDDTTAIITVQFDGQKNDLTGATLDAVRGSAAQLQSRIGDGARVEVGGSAFDNVIPTISVTEAIGVVLALIFLIIFLHNVLAAFVPIVMALVGVGVTESLVYAATGVMTIMSTTVLLSVMIGLAVGIDYSLFIISRYRDNLAQGLDPEESVARSIATAGTAVLFAGMTVVIALVGLFVARIPFLTIMGVASAFGVATAVCVALTLLPATLGFFGTRITPRARRSRSGRDGFFGHWVRLVTARPLVTIVLVVAAVAALAVPATGLRLSLPMESAAEAGTDVRTTYDTISDEFGPGYNGPLIVVVNVLDSTDPIDGMNRLGDDLATIDGVAHIAMSTPNESGTYGIVQVIPSGSPDSAATADLVQALRDRGPAMADRYGFRDFAVTGITAVAVDVSAKLTSALLPYGVFVVGLSLVLLVMVFGSIAVPIKATIGYLLSILASFGVTTSIFVDGHLASRLGADFTGSLICFLPIIVMGVLFGLAMDYEVFLVSRTAEEYVHSGDPVQAIHNGFRKAAPVVSTAALIMLSVFAMFIPEGSSGIIKPIATALTVGVFVDAFIVRMTFVPAVLTLLGHRAWSMPERLARALPRFDVEGAGLARQLSLEGWPADPHEAVATRAMVVRDRNGAALNRPIDLDLHPGRIAVLTGPEGSGKSELMLGLTGRLAGFDGDARVAGLLLPERNAAVRSRSVLASGGKDVNGVLAEGLHRGVALAAVDDADAVIGANRTARARELIGRLVADGACVLLTGANPGSVAHVLPAGAVPVEIPMEPPPQHARPAPQRTGDTAGADERSARSTILLEEASR